MIGNSLGDYIKKSQKGKPNGVCALDANGKVPFDSIDMDVNVLEFKGTWDAMINLPSLTNGMSVLATGNVYICSVAGTQFGIDFETGDFVIYDGTNWKRVSGVSYNTSVSNTDGKLVVSGTLTDPIINVAQSFRWGNGSYKPLVYQLQSGIGSSSQIAMNATLISSISQMSIGFSGYNGGSDSDLSASTQAVLEYIKDNLPHTIRIVDTTNTSNHYTMTLNSYAGASAGAYLFNCSYVSAQTNITNIPALGTLVYMLVDYTGITNKTAITTNTNNIATLTTNKIDTITSGNNFLTVTGTGASRALTVKSNVYLSGTVNITNGGLLQLGGVSQTGHPYSSSGSTMTVLDDLIVDGTFTMASGSNLIVEGNFIVLGSVNLTSTSTITTRGIIHFRGKTSADTFISNGCTFNTYDEFSIRNYTSTAYIYFGGATTNTINAKTITFENNTTSCFFDTTTTHILNADTVLWNNNSNQASGTGNNSTVRLYNVTIKAVSVKFSNNTSVNYACDLRQSVSITANIIEFTSNVNTVAGAYTVFLSTTITLTSDKLLFQNNTHSTDIAVVLFTSSVNFVCKNIAILNNSATTYGFYSETGCTINSDYIHIKTSGATQHIMQKGNVYGLYSTTRTPQFIIDNSGSTITGFNADSYLGMIPFCFKQFENYNSPYNPSVTTTVGALKLSPSYTYGPTLGAGYTQFGLLNTQFSATGTNSRLQYTGKDNAYVKIDVMLSYRATDATVQTYTFEIYKNGSTYVAGQFSSTGSSAGNTPVSMCYITTASINDYFELSAYAKITNTNIYINNINWTITKMSVM